jgi:hypothetical protein
MKFPGRSQREAVHYDGSWGAQLEAEDTSRAGVVDDGLVAWPERIVEAERQWFHARAEDFEQIGRRRFRDRATGIEFVQPHGSPLLSIGAPASDGVSVFIV